MSVFALLIVLIALPIALFTLLSVWSALLMVSSTLFIVFVALAIKLESSTFCVMFLKFFNDIRISSIASEMPGDVMSVFALLMVSSTLFIVFVALAIKLESSSFCVMFLKFFNDIRISSNASEMPCDVMSVFALFMVLAALLIVLVALVIKLESSIFCVMFLKFFNAIRTSSIASGMPGVPISILALFMASSALCIVLLAVSMVSINTDVTSSISIALSLANRSSAD